MSYNKSPAFLCIFFFPRPCGGIFSVLTARRQGEGGFERVFNGFFVIDGGFMPVVVLTAGHGAGDPGAVNGDVREADVATEMRDIAAHILRQDYGLTVRTDGVRGENLPLADALKLIGGADLAVEIHCNASADKSAGGIEALADVRLKGACQRLCAAVSAVTGWKVRGREGGWKPDSAGQHRRLAYARAGGIVFEPFFISNDADLKLFKERKWIICRAVADAVARELGVNGKAV